jgi:hypothetical protein
VSADYVNEDSKKASVTVTGTINGVGVYVFSISSPCNLQHMNVQAQVIIFQHATAAAWG